MTREISETYQLQKAIYFMDFEPTSSIDGQHRLRVKEENPGSFTIRRWRWPFGASIYVKGQIGHDLYIDNITITYPYPPKGWVNAYVNLLKEHGHLERKREPIAV